ncbi:MAG TPA: hypothetical protein VMT17_01865 [Anaeromyxobacteraceae bacterium]|nr:hypothetical protein [Anaeromyxobacteraceae bacterium]
MTRKDANSTPLHISPPRRHALRDAAVVAFLVVVLGAFLAQIASAPRSPGAAPAAAAAVAPA